MSRKADEADHETRLHGSGADAILYVVPPVARQSDADLLKDFQDTTRLPNSPPHNSLAVIHKWEALDSIDPHAEALHKAGRIYQAMRDFISGAMPVSAPLGRAAERFPDAFWESILNLAGNTPARDLDELLLDERDFRENDCSGCPLDAAARGRLLLLPWPCLKVILQLARRQAPATAVDLRKRILETSGLVRLRQEIHNRFFARAKMLKWSKLLTTALEPCAQAQRSLHNYKRDLNQDLQKADQAKIILAERIRCGDSALLPAQEFIDSAASKLEEDMHHAGDNLGHLGAIVLNVKEPHEQMERDLSMLDLLDQPTDGVAPETLEMLRCLFGRCGADATSRLSFFADLGKATVGTADLVEAIGGLRQLRFTAPRNLQPVFDHAIARLEQIANWMKKNHRQNICIASGTTQP